MMHRSMKKIPIVSIHENLKQFVRNNFIVLFVLLEAFSASNMAKALKVSVIALVAIVIITGIGLGIFYGTGNDDGEVRPPTLEPVTLEPTTLKPITTDPVDPFETTIPVPVDPFLSENGIHLTLRGKNIRLISGSIHYRRVH